jgi:hypothetical protein
LQVCLGNRQLTRSLPDHFLFGERPRDTQKVKDGIGKASLKHNPILTALSEDRFPSERPNYEYFAQILALNEQVQFRPKRCWIFVSHKDVVVGEDGSGYLAGSAAGSKLSESEYPHLPRNLDRETWAKEEQQLFKGALLHEFTKEITQRESGSVRELTKDWDSAFPDLQSRLKTITSTTTDARCDFLHLHATLELKEKRSFPAGSSLSSWVEINLEQPRLLNHRWKVETRLVRPWELSSDDTLHGDPGQEVIHDRQKEFTIKYHHRAGCEGSLGDGRGQCDCHTQRSRRDGISVPFPVPFPATAWAQTLTNCAEYPAHPFLDSKRRGREGVKMEIDDDEGPKLRRRGEQPTQMDLVPRIAMMQEISSSPPTSAHEGASSDAANQRWTRRAVILWTFETIHSIQKADGVKKGGNGISKGGLVTAPGGKTDWRFLTILDPASEYHQRHAISSGRRSSADEYRGFSGNVACGSRPSSRATIMSPSPTYQQHLSGGMSENFPSAWDVADGLGSLTGSAAQAAYGAHFISQTMASHTPSQAEYGLLDSFSSHSALATPHPSASLGSSFAQTFDTASTGSDILPSYVGTHAAVTTGGMDAGSHTLGGALSAVTDPFLAHVGGSYGGAQDGIHGWDSHGVSGAMDSAAASWQSGYSNPNPTHMHTGGAANWSGPHPHSHPRRSSEHHRHDTQYHRQDRHHQPWAPAITTTNPPSNSIDDSDAWTPITSATPSGGGGETTNTAATRADSHGHHHQSQEWVHIPVPSTTSDTSQDPSQDLSQDLSQDWEEIVPSLPPPPPMVEQEQQLSSLSPSSSESEAEYHHRHHHHQQQQQQQQQQQHMDVPAMGGHASSSSSSSRGIVTGRKRTRSDSFEEGEEGEYRRARVRG